MKLTTFIMENAETDIQDLFRCARDFGKTFRKYVLNSEIDEPIIFKKLHSKWEPVLWDLNCWGKLFVRDGKEEKLACRIGQQNYEFNEPQWETTTQIKRLLWSELINWSDESQWAYYDYKNIIQVFENSYLKNFEWSSLGFPERTGNVGNIWIGTKGSYTPCHFDTYGCNLVSQIYGRKTWLLFPPTESKHLHPTRIPYEESSVYSQVNFIAPSKPHLEGLKLCSPLRVTLEPGDVLFLPPKWWHFVQSEDFTISVNTWIELPQDRKSRVEESLMRFMVGSIVSLTTPETTADILNPNEEDLTAVTECQLEKMLEKTSEHFLQFARNGCADANGANESHFVHDDFDDNHYPKKPKLSVVDTILSLCPGSERLPRYSFSFPECLASLEDSKLQCDYSRNKFLRHFINAIGHPSILKQISEKFLENVSNEPDNNKGQTQCYVKQ